MIKCSPYIGGKALNGIQWEVAHPLSLNYGAPIAYMDATICVSGGGTPYIGITKGFMLYQLVIGSHWIPLRAFAQGLIRILPT